VTLSNAAPPPVVLPAIAASEVTSPSDFFRCVPYGVKLLASACLARQKKAGGASFGTSSAGTRYSKDYLEKCRNCVHGKGIAERCAGKASSSNPTLDAVSSALPPAPVGRRKHVISGNANLAQESRMRGAKASARARKGTKKVAADDDESAPAWIAPANNETLNALLTGGRPVASEQSDPPDHQEATETRPTPFPRRRLRPPPL